ncbi:MAG: ArgE/DapE family deacylase [Candidatus Freyarchaeota archaeon]|nr:ArgE/DapE family deacylase [Candidatus Jordarchaeia archaeon]
MQEEYVFKIVVIGDGGVGKTSLILTLTENRFPTDYRPTLGADFASYKVDLDGKLVTLQLWDLGGQPSFAHLRSFFYTEAKGGVIVFDLTNMRSFENVEKWHDEVTSICGKIPIVLVGNKHDLVDERRVPRHEAEQLARKLGALYFETSAKTRFKVDEAFIAAARLILGIREEAKAVPLKVTPELRKRLLEVIDESEDYAINLLRDLISAQSVNPPGWERGVAEIVLGELYRIGAQTEIYEKVEGRTNVVGRLGDGEPRLMLAAHLDVVAPGDGWIYPPFRATVKEGYVIGRGSADAKGPLTSMVLALYAIKKLNLQLGGTVLLVAAADGEAAGELGMKYLLKERKINVDYAIIGGNTRSKNICVAERGILWLKVVCRGRTVHASKPHEGANAVQALIKLLGKVSEIKFDVPPHPLMGEVTMNIGSIQGGTGINMVPGRAEATIDIRYTPAITEEEIISRLTEIIRETEEEVKGVEMSLEVILSEPPTEINQDQFLVQMLKKNVEEVTGEKMELVGENEAMMTKVCMLNGIPAVSFGPGEDEQKHRPNEKISIKELLTAAKVIALTIFDILSQTKQQLQTQNQKIRV